MLTFQERDSMENNIIKSIFRPTTLNKENYATLWQYKPEEGEDRWYIQASYDKDKAEWKLLGDVMFGAFKPLVTQEEFIQLILCLYHKSNQYPL